MPARVYLAGFSAHQNPPPTIHSVVRRMGTPESCSRPEPAPPGGQTSALSQTAVSAIRGLRESANCNPTTAEERTAQRAPGTERFAPKNSAADHRFTKSVNSSSQQISAVGAQHSQRTKKKPPLSQAEPPSKMLGPSGEFVELRVSGVPRLRSDAPEAHLTQARATLQHHVGEIKAGRLDLEAGLRPAPLLVLPARREHFASQGRTRRAGLLLDGGGRRAVCEVAACVEIKILRRVRPLIFSQVAADQRPPG